MLRCGIFRSGGVPRANHALMHTFSGVSYTYSVGIALLVHYLWLWKAASIERAEG